MGYKTSVGECESITEGSLNTEIRLVRLERKDEFEILANDINIMRKSLVERMELERSAIIANKELITSLSHDLRTPLTKQMCAIELALKSGTHDDNSRQCLERIYKHSQQKNDFGRVVFVFSRR